MPSFSHTLHSKRRNYCPLLRILGMRIHDIIIVNSSDDESDTEEQEFEWEPTKKDQGKWTGKWTSWTCQMPYHHFVVPLIIV